MKLMIRRLSPRVIALTGGILVLVGIVVGVVMAAFEMSEVSSYEPNYKPPPLSSGAIEAFLYISLAVVLIGSLLLVIAIFWRLIQIIIKPRRR